MKLLKELKNLNADGKFLKHLLESRVILYGLEHFIVTFPSVLLVSRMSVFNYYPILSVSSILFACGVGTFFMVFRFRWKTRRLPLLLGPSFAYIGFTSYMISQYGESGDPNAYIVWGYLFSALLLVITGIVYKKKPKGFKWFLDIVFPTPVMGAAVSLIGLELASKAIEGINIHANEGNTLYIVIAIGTLTVIIWFAVYRSALKHWPILFGVLIGTVAWYVLPSLFSVFYQSTVDYPLSEQPITEGFGDIISRPFVQWSIPFDNWVLIGLRFPRRWLSILVAVIPPTLVAFSETIGRTSIFKGMIVRFDENNKELKERTENVGPDASIDHSLSSLFSSIVGTVPTAIYAENLAIMNLHADTHTRDKRTRKRNKIKQKDNNYNTHTKAIGVINTFYNELSIIPYIIAAGAFIIASFVGFFDNIMLFIPDPVYDGMGLFIFALIAAPGVQMLVDEYVNYGKITNQILTGGVLLAGVSPISIPLGTIELSGMSLGLFIGLILNFSFRFITLVGKQSERITLYELYACCNVKIEKYLREHRPRILKYSRQTKYVKDFDYDINPDKARDIEEIVLCCQNGASIALKYLKEALTLEFRLSNILTDDERFDLDLDEFVLNEKDYCIFEMKIDSETSTRTINNILDKYLIKHMDEQEYNKPILFNLCNKYVEKSLAYTQGRSSLKVKYFNQDKYESIPKSKFIDTIKNPVAMRALEGISILYDIDKVNTKTLIITRRCEKIVFQLKFGKSSIDSITKLENVIKKLYDCDDVFNAVFNTEDEKSVEITLLYDSSKESINQIETVLRSCIPEPEPESEQLTLLQVFD